MTATAPATPDVLAAYQHCEQITRTQARNFSYGIALLPGAKRRALSAVYAFARRIDDIGDGDLPPAVKLAALAQARAEVEQLAAGAAPPPGDLVLAALADAAGRFEIPLAAFGELIEGCEADVRGTVYRTWADLEHYCRCVAGSIGRLSLGVFGAVDMAAAAPLADALGVALQLTNILRDIREDLGTGRVYLPADDLAASGCALAPVPPGGELPWASDTSGMEQVIRFEVERARTWYAAGLALMPMLDWRSAASAGAMAGIYLRLLGHIAATPAEVLDHRMSLPAKEKLMVAARSLAGRPPRPPAGVEPATPAKGAAAAGEAIDSGTGVLSGETGQADPVRPVAGGAP